MRRPAERLRRSVEAMPRITREAMLRGISVNRIIAGAYADKRTGGVCPMLAAHRHGGRTDFGTFARAWDEFTGETHAKRPRRATKREVGALVGYLENSLMTDTDVGPLKDVVARVRSERRASATLSARETVQPDRSELQKKQPAVEPPSIADPEEIEVEADLDSVPPRGDDPIVERIVDEVVLRQR